MADLNDEVNAISEHLRRLNMEFNRYGELTSQSADAIRRKTSAETYRDTQLEKSGQAAAESLQSLTKAVGSSATALYEGRQGATAFNDSIANMNIAIKQAAIALAVLAPGGVAVKVVASGLTALGLGIFTVVEEMQATSRTLLDTSYDSYKKLSAAGAATSTGLEGVAESAAKTGVSMLKMDEYLSLIGSNSDNLALFGKTVFDGRRKFDNLGAALEGERQKLFALGMTQDDINESMMGFIRLQVQSGRARTISDNELIAGTKKYLYEQDELRKLTGMNRKEQQATREAAQAEQRFGAKIAAMRASGDERQIAAADELLKQNDFYAKNFPHLAKGFRDLTTGMMTSEDAIKLNITSQGQAVRDINDVIAGVKSGGEAAYSTLQATAKGAEKFNFSYQAGIGENFLLPFAETQKARLYQEKDFNEDMARVKLERDKITGGEPGANPLLGQYATLLKDQQTAFTTLQQALVQGFKIGPIKIGITEALSDVNESVQKAVMGALDKYFRAFGTYPPPPKASADEAPIKLNEQQQVVRDKAAAEVNAAYQELVKAENQAAKAKDELNTAKKEAQRLLTANASQEEKQAAADKLKLAKKTEKEANEKLAAATTARNDAAKKLVLAKAGQAVETTPAPPVPAPVPAPPVEQSEEDQDKAAKDAEAKKAEIAKAKEALLAPSPELKVGGKTAFKDLVQEQKDAINHLLENMGGRPIMGQTPGDDRGKEIWEKELRKSPREQQVLFDAINEQIKNERKKKLEELEKQESDNTSKATPAGPNDSRKNQVADAAVLADSQVAAATTKVVNIAEALPTRTDINDATAGLTINSDVATLNSKGMNVTLDNSSDVAKLIMEPMITQMETSQKDQSMARSNFEASIGDLKAEFSKQKATDELLLAAVQELIRIQKNGVSVNEKILAAQA
jgi:hypothetical protein